MRTTAAVLREPDGGFEWTDVELDDPREHEVLVRVTAAGVCHTDAVVRHGSLPVAFPIVLGHEGAGVVEAVGDGVTSVSPGDHVLMSFASCGACRACRRDQPAYCRLFFPLNFAGRRADGSGGIADDVSEIGGRFFGQSCFAAHALATERNVVPVADDLPLELLAPFGCSVQTGAGAVLRSLRVQPGDAVGVAGLGAVGLAAVMAARFAGAGSIVAVDRDPQRLALALEIGATSIIDTRETDLPTALRDAAPDGLDAAVDTTGSTAVIRTLVLALAAQGCVGVVGATPGPGAELVFDYRDVLLSGKRVMGIIEGDSDPQRFVPELVDLFRQGRFPVDRLVTRYPADRIAEAFDDAAAGRVIKPVLLLP